MEIKDKKCLCGEGEFIVMACSGASDLGKLSDVIARKLSENNVRKMSCLAIVGAGIQKSIESFKSKNLLVIDGCPIDCGKRMMNNSGIENYNHLRLTDLGCKKGETPLTEDVINNIYEKAELIY
nr:zinc-binding protein [Bacteroidota bacterium]